MAQSYWVTWEWLLTYLKTRITTILARLRGVNPLRLLPRLRFPSHGLSPPQQPPIIEVGMHNPLLALLLERGNPLLERYIFPLVASLAVL